MPGPPATPPRPGRRREPTERRHVLIVEHLVAVLRELLGRCAVYSMSLARSAWADPGAMGRGAVEVESRSARLPSVGTTPGRWGDLGGRRLGRGGHGFHSVAGPSDTYSTRASMKTAPVPAPPQVRGCFSVVGDTGIEPVTSSVS